MRSVVSSVLVLAVLGIAWLWSPAAASGSATQRENDPAVVAVQKGVKWLVSVQGRDGGWGQDGGETPYVRNGERLESNGNDAANTAVAALALLHAGEHQASVNRALDFLLRSVETSPADGLAIASVTGSQIQRKLGPYIDTFLTSVLLSELDGNMGDARANQRVRSALQKCVAKIEKNQLKDGSWNIAGGWAPILGTSMASRSLFVAQQKGVKVDSAVQDKVEVYAKAQAAPVTSGVGTGSGGGVAGGVYRVGGVVAAPAAAAGVPLYSAAQAIEQLSRTEADRKKNAREIKAIAAQLSQRQFVSGFGSMGGEEFFSYLNISDSLHRTGGEEWKKWNGDIKARIVKLQNDDGTWAGQHCITGRVAVTSAAILTLLAERDPALMTAAKPAKN